MTVRDEVCGMTITEDQIAETLELGGTTYHFCSERCKDRFEEHPDWYVAVNDDGAGDDGEGSEGSA